MLNSIVETKLRDSTLIHKKESRWHLFRQKLPNLKAETQNFEDFETAINDSKSNPKLIQRGMLVKLSENSSVSEVVVGIGRVCFSGRSRLCGLVADPSLLITPSHVELSRLVPQSEFKELPDETRIKLLHLYFENSAHPKL